MIKIILFVCIENSARSQMAEGFFNYYNKNPEYKGMSAGTNPSEEIKEKAIRVMKEKGIDISNQKPTLLTRNMADEAFRIYTMGCIKGCPITPHEKTYEWNFDDPSGKQLEEFRKVRDKIELKIKKLILDDNTSGEKKGFLGKLFSKLDEKLEEKSKDTSCSCSDEENKSCCK